MYFVVRLKQPLFAGKISVGTRKCTFTRSLTKAQQMDYLTFYNEDMHFNRVLNNSQIDGPLDI
jgi:hypothetical protein